ncbi:neuronal PAS domain-containing protein 3 isoform X2 [Kryptolebias marmoratus]|uniref:neuronal PAS domain-containing protein 3 isoform X2 n=1 Tax=Kryptolebias marmoratus TaxID=37003 RepID=UPI0018AC9DF3|nr:neuronal PAS domain-containing protein 3 isoform X2 [Kryptolebias marmoratus]
MSGILKRKLEEGPSSYLSLQGSDDDEVSCSDSGNSSDSLNHSVPSGILDSSIQQPSKRLRGRNVHFESVTVYYFTRRQGFTTVPTQGGSTLGMSPRHSGVRRFTLREFAMEQKRSHRNMLRDHLKEEKLNAIKLKLTKNGTVSSIEADTLTLDDISEDDLDVDNTEVDDYFFLQPLTTRRRRALLRASGVRRIDVEEKHELRALRMSREECGCRCRGICDPETCACSLAGIKCQVDRMSFPCGCTKEGCSNSTGRLEFNPVRVRTHFLHTIMKLELEKSHDEQYQHQQTEQQLVTNGNGYHSDTTFIPQQQPPNPQSVQMNGPLHEPIMQLQSTGDSDLHLDEEEEEDEEDEEEEDDDEEEDEAYDEDGSSVCSGLSDCSTHSLETLDPEEGEEDEEDEDEEDEEEGGGVQDCDGANAGSKLQKRRKRRKVQKWDGLRSRRLRLSTAPPSPSAADDATPPVDPSEATPIPSTHLLTSSGSPSSTGATSSVLKIKTEMAEPINFDNNSSIWNYPPNREISRNESPYSMTSKLPASGGHETFPSPQGGSLHVVIPDSVLTPPGTEGGAGGVRKPPYNGSSAPSSSSSTTSLAPPSNTSSADPLSPPLSASPRDKQQGTPTTSSSSSSTSSSSSSTSSSSSLLYSGDLEALQRLQAGNVVLPLVHRVTGTLAPSSTTAPRVYTTGTIRYAPADVTLAMAQGNLLPNAAMNFVDSSGFGLDPKTPMEMLYHHVHRLNMTAAAAAGPFVGSTAPAGGNGALGGQMPAATNVFTTAEGLFSTLPFPVYSNGIHTTQTALERKED